jgi:hypothetical protein
VVVIEVMIRRLDKAWWRAYREKLEATFRQEQIMPLPLVPAQW